MIPKNETHADASSGATQPAGKSSDCEATLGKNFPRPVSTVKTAEEDKGAAKKCIWQQVGPDGDSDPKMRARNFWGTSSKNED